MLVIQFPPRIQIPDGDDIASFVMRRGRAVKSLYVGFAAFDQCRGEYFAVRRKGRSGRALAASAGPASTAWWARSKCETWDSNSLLLAISHAILMLLT